MKKNKPAVRDPNVVPPPVQDSSQRKVRGYDEIAPFLHEVQKIVDEECAQHPPHELPWYPIWQQWSDKHLMLSPSINDIGKIICPELKYKERTIIQIVKRITTDITPVANYIQVTHVSDTSVVWDSLIEVVSFKSLKKKKRPKTSSGRQLTTGSYGECTSSQDENTLSSNNPPQLDMQDEIITQLSLQQPSQATAPMPRPSLPTTIPPAIESPDTPPTEVII